MKSFGSNFTRLATAAAIAITLFIARGASAQIPGGGATSLMNAVILRLFGSNTNFISKLEVHSYDKTNRETGSILLGFERLGDKVRYEVDMTKVKSKEISPEFVTTMKEMGMDPMIVVRLPEKKATLSICPNMKAYAEAPMDKDDIQALNNNAKIEKVRQGHETIDGHPTDKYTVTATEANGHRSSVIIVWYATDMKDFPLQLQVPSDETTLMFRFHDVKLGRPELAHFDPPAGMTKYPDLNALMSAAVSKKMRANSPK